MRKNIIVFSILSLLFLLSACHPGNDEPLTQTKVRTVLVYIAADNSLSSFASEDLSEMVQGMRKVDTNSYNLLVYYDDHSAPTLLRLINKKGKIIKDTIFSYQEQNSVDVSVMKAVLKKAFTSYPADSYGLVLWSHGEGWLPSKSVSSFTKTRWWGVDESSKMDILDLEEALSVAPHLDFILFDACFMQSIEVAYELKDCADYFIASPTETPGSGAPYEDVVPAFFSGKTGDSFATGIGDSYYDYYRDLYDETKETTDDNWTGGVSIGVLKGSSLDDLASATKEIITAHVKDGASVVDASKLFYYHRSELTYYYYDIKDLISTLTGQDSSYETWLQAFDNAMISYHTTAKNYYSIPGQEYGGLFSMKGSCGVSTYILNSGHLSLNTYYHKLQWYEAAGWSETGW